MISEKRISIRERKRLSAYGMFLFLLLLPFEYPLVTFGAGSILRYVGIAVMGLALLDIFRSGAKIRMDYRVSLLLVWMLYAVISGLWCVDKEQYKLVVSMYINNALMFLLITAVDFTPKDAKLVKNGLIGGIVLLLLYMTFVPGAVASSSWQSRLTLAYKGKQILDQNYLAALMLMPFGIVLYDLMNAKQKGTALVLKILFVLAILYYILRTGSRGGLLAAGLVAFLCICVGIRQRKAVTWILVILVFLLMPMMLNVLPDDLLERFSLEAMTGGTSESGGRLKIWKAAWEAIKSGGFVFGYGAGGATTVIGWNYYYDAAVHNAVIAQVLELGIAGLSLWMVLIVKMIKELWQQKNRNLIFAFCGILAAGMFLDVLTTKFFWGAMMMLTVQIGASRNAPTIECTDERPDGMQQK